MCLRQPPHRPRPAPLLEHPAALLKVAEIGADAVPEPARGVVASLHRFCAAPLRTASQHVFMPLALTCRTAERCTAPLDPVPTVGGAVVYRSRHQDCRPTAVVPAAIGPGPGAWLPRRPDHPVGCA